MTYLKELHICEVIQNINFEKITKTEPFKNLPQFYKDVIESFVICNAASDKSDNVCARELCIWGNVQIVNRQKEVLYFPTWIKSGFVLIKDFRFINCKIDEGIILSRLQNKANYLSEMFQIKFAINQFASKAPKCFIKLAIITQYLVFRCRLINDKTGLSEFCSKELS